MHVKGNNEGAANCAGIIGTLQFGKSANINDCYNIGQINETSYKNTGHGVGGIVGVLYDNNTSIKSKANINNCYNIGNINNTYSATYAGQIIGRDYNYNSIVNGCYYLNTASGNNTCGGTALSSDILKTYASTLGESFTTDNINSGYPILKWEIE